MEQLTAHPGPSLAGIFCSVSHDSPLHHELTLIDTCLGGHRGNKHAALATDWALPHRRAGEFFIGFTIVLGDFQG